MEQILRSEVEAALHQSWSRSDIGLDLSSHHKLLPCRDSFWRRSVAVIVPIRQAGRQSNPIQRRRPGRHLCRARRLAVARPYGKYIRRRRDVHIRLECGRPKARGQTSATA